MSELKKRWEEMLCHVDGHNWYWLSYGEKCYAFAVVTAFPIEDGPSPPSGGRLDPHEELPHAWVAEDGTAMYVDDWIARIESQNGGPICRWIAQAYADAQERS